VHRTALEFQLEAAAGRRDPTTRRAALHSRVGVATNRARLKTPHTIARSEGPYAIEGSRLEADRGSRLRAVTRREQPLAATAVADEFKAICERVAIRTRQDGSKVYYLDVRLVA
jgi:hypothetical protein